MKQLSFFLCSLIGIVTFISCGNELDYDDTNDNEKDIELAMDDTVVKFKDQAVFDATMNKLAQMNENQLSEWSSSLGIKSLFSLHMEALQEAGTMDDSADDYLNLKGKYSDFLYFPEYKDDYGIYLPVTNKLYSAVMNGAGNVMIGNEVKNFIDIKDYQSLQKTGRALYEGEATASPQLRAEDDIVYVFEGETFGPSYDSGWKIVGDRMYKITAVRRMYSCSTSGSLKFHDFDVRLMCDSRRLINGVWTTYSGISHISAGSVTVYAPTYQETLPIYHNRGNVYLYAGEIEYVGAYPHEISLLNKYPPLCGGGRGVYIAYRWILDLTILSLGAQNDYQFELGMVTYSPLYN